MELNEIEYCFDCTKANHRYSRGYPAFEYNESIKESIFRFKYGNRREYAKFYGKAIMKRYGSMLKMEKFDVIIPVPLSRKRLQKRGFNQAELIANEIGRYLNIPVDTKSLRKKKDTRQQKLLNNNQRHENLKNAFKIYNNGVKLKKILLIDDIYTTGSTVNACSTKLMEKGALEVSYVSVAIGRGM